MSVDIPQNMQASQTIDAIYKSYIAIHGGEGWRPHLGASRIGEPCRRKLWYEFRWFLKTQFPGRIHRLFQTGHLEEIRIVQDLRNAGVEVLDVNPETGEQWRVQDKDNTFFSGSIDGICHGLLESPTNWHICEFKTCNDKNYKLLVKKGVKAHYPMHYAQKQVYMHLFRSPLSFNKRITRTLYVAQNKNDDNLHMERIKYDEPFAVSLCLKAETIVQSKTAPDREYNSDETFGCRFCDYKDICWEGSGDIEKNCRTCKNSSPSTAPEFYCNEFEKYLTVDNQKAGCETGFKPLVNIRSQKPTSNKLSPFDI